MGRPRLSDPGVAVRIRVRSSALDLLKQAADERGTDLSSLCRSILNEYLKDYRDEKDIPRPDE